ncbi:DUF5060 domain-containing protein [Paenibacillus rigui]|uniref:DUF5060 domain-containing protein n=1 Tax=Paenibacillus rigui TaxID=554312 RepID=A0A229UVW4_9BACL|nr:DUF5060 domain-containing protein [Paenibacillus rigui]OXM87441.1 DUF5060 domain-containing protein [Paenibacillus rigui]
MRNEEASRASAPVERWGRFERSFDGPAEGNPYREVTLRGVFRHGSRSVEADGFYNGEGTYKLRFMPDAEGTWTYTVASSSAELDGLQGSFEVVPPQPGNHGPVRVKDRYRFEYADGTAYLPFGTTLYHWCHHGDEAKEEATLASLAESPFNKVRICVLPTGDMDPPSLAFAGSLSEGADVNRMNPDFFAHLEKRLDDLLRLGVEADLILFHPYDRDVWGFERLEAETEDFYIRYVLARLGSFRNVWWSIANEFDFNKHKTMEDWDRLFHVVQRHDPYNHLRSIHNGTKMYDYTRTATYDYSKPWVTHQSVQHWEPSLTSAWLETHRKPVVLDECCYEGTAERRWGNISGEEMVRRFWECMVRGGYAAHGEVFGRGSWVSSGGTLVGESPQRIAFLRKLMEESLPELGRAEAERSCLWVYFGVSRPSYWELSLPEGNDYFVDVVDTWGMRVERLKGTFRGNCTIELPGISYAALRMTVV